jgi:lipid-A-disaccharide synthase
VIQVDYISLVNLILGRPLVKELIQNECTVARIDKELRHLIQTKAYRAEMVNGYKELSKMLGEPGVSERVAEKMVMKTKTKTKTKTK